MHDIFRRRRNWAVLGVTAALATAITVPAVSFADTAMNPSRFIVDVWKRDGDGWQLAVRYQGDVAATKAGTRRAPRVEKKY